MDEINKYGDESVQKYLVGNKCDLAHSRQVSEEEGKALAKKLGVPFAETSAKFGQNIKELFESLTGNVIKSKQGK